jgi:microcystin-dependent protein
VTLTTQQMPIHSHTFLATTGLATQPTPGGNVPAQSGSVQLWTEDTPAAPLAAQAIVPTGGSQPHDNMHPYLVINFVISLFGRFPNQT